MQEDTLNIHFNSRIELSQLQEKLAQVRAEFQKVIIGHEQTIDYLLTALLSHGHLLLESPPGLAKTLMAKTLSRIVAMDFSRIQFTPDLMPSDILGTSVFNLKTSDFEFKKGPIFANLILIDEINRAPAKTQSALFEVMQERQITIDGQQFLMALPFWVIATENPIEQEGTYRLPEAQLDRFLFKLNLNYPDLAQEIAIIEQEHSTHINDKTLNATAVLSGQELIELQQLVKSVSLEPHLFQYIAKLVQATRHHRFLFSGASPRASIGILNASKSWAILQGRDFVTPEDIRAVAVPVLAHRVVVSGEKQIEGVNSTEIITELIHTIEIPR